LKKSFFAPVIDQLGFVARDKVPGWSARAPTVAPPAALPILGPPVAKIAAPEPAKAKRPAKPGDSADPNDPLPSDLR
jgi:hypothetical protein